MSIHNPKNPFPINELYAVLSEDDTGEGIVGANVGGKPWPVVSGYKHVIDALTPLLEKTAKDNNKILKLYKFTNKEFIKEYK